MCARSGFQGPSRPPGLGGRQHGNIPPVKHNLCKSGRYLREQNLDKTIPMPELPLRIPFQNSDHCWQPIGILRFTKI